MSLFAAELEEPKIGILVKGLDEMNIFLMKNIEDFVIWGLVWTESLTKSHNTMYTQD